MKKDSKIYIAGHHGMVGSAIKRKLLDEGYTNPVLRSSAELDLRDQHAVTEFFKDQSPEYVFLAAAHVGGIHANNTYRAEFIYDNLMIQTNVIHAAYISHVKKLLFLGSSCIYPKFARQPMDENQLLTGALESTNEPYAVAKIAGIKMCQAYQAQYGCNFISLMPTNLYGPNDNYDLENGHVLPALVRKIVDGKNAGSQSVEVWGSGLARREFLYVDDLASACLFLMNVYDNPAIINVGTGEDITIKELATIIKATVGYTGELVFDTSRPDGTPKKLLDISRILSWGWRPQTSLTEGIERVCLEYLARSVAQHVETV
jgi:GDP-L-fucose synthase